MEMLTNAAIASKLAPEPSKHPLKTPKDGGAHGKTASRDGDVLEMRSKTTEEFRFEEHVTISSDARALAARACGSHGLSSDAAAGAEDTDQAADAEAMDPKEKQLKDLREWAKQVEREVRLQQHKILERMLKQSAQDGGKEGGKHESPFLVVTPDGVCAKPPDGGCARPGNAEKTEEAQVPEYWNAENTSDRIVHFATQMAEISGIDLREFGEIIKEAVSKGFDQAGAATGELTGAAAKLNKDTKDLVFAKLSKWLEEHVDMPYNQGAQKPAAAGVPGVAGNAPGTATGPG